MKLFKIFAIIVSSITLTCGATAYIVVKNSQKTASDESLTTNEDRDFAYTKNGMTLNVNSKSLIFNVVKNGKTYYSSLLNEADTTMTSNKNKAFATSPLTIGYFYNINSLAERSMSDSTKKSRTFVTYTSQEYGFSAKVKFQDINNLVVTLNVSLTENGVNISIPYEGITEGEYKENASRLAYITVYPFFANSYGLIDDGYIMLPDGSGSLIDLSKKTNAKKPFDKKIYDKDIGITDSRKSSTSSSTLSMGMYALNDNNTTLISSISEGDEYANLSCYVNGISNAYNYAYYTYTYRDSYQRYNSGDTTKYVGAAQKELNVFNMSCDYLLDGDLTPSETANKYKELLVSKDLLSSTNNNSNSSLLHLEFLLAENKESIFGRSLVKMSDTNFVKDVVKACSSLTDYIFVSLLGYTSGGLTNSYPNHLGVEGQCGGDSGAKELGAYLKENNYEYSFNVDYTQAYENSGIDSKDKAMNMSEKYIVSPSAKQGSTQKFYSLTLKKTETKLNEESNKFKDLNATSLDYNSIGNTLYSSYFNETFSRKEAKEKYIELLKTSKLKNNLNHPNIYAYKYMTSYLNAETDNNDFLIETSSFPLIPMILSGKNNLYSEAINLNYLGEDQILDLINYNIKPSFLLTENDPIDLFKTDSEYIYTSMYSSWKDDIASISKETSEIFKSLGSAEFLTHEIITDGVYLNTYSNGKKVYVNYSDTTFINSEVSVESKKAEVI